MRYFAEARAQLGVPGRPVNTYDTYMPPCYYLRDSLYVDGSQVFDGWKLCRKRGNFLSGRGSGSKVCCDDVRPSHALSFVRPSRFPIVTMSSRQQPISPRCVYYSARPTPLLSDSLCHPDWTHGSQADVDSRSLLDGSAGTSVDVHGV